MNFFKYIGVTEDEFVEKYLNTGLVASQKHPTLPLAIFAYGRKAVHENVWDGVTSKCRGIVVDIETDEIVARPFEKFHNFGTTCVEGCTPESNSIFGTQPVIWEKMDGFMITAFLYRGEWHAASKASFTSIHAKWATAELRRKISGTNPTVQALSEAGYFLRKTLMFEGLHPDLRIVVDYKTPAELVLLTVIDNETGAEYLPDELRMFSEFWGFNVPDQHSATWQSIHDETIIEHNSYAEEGYVLTWYRPGTTPFRLKMKFIDYLRLHRMVTGVSPKRIWAVLAGAQTAELDEYLNSSTPWFAEFVTKWVSAFKKRYAALLEQANNAYYVARDIVRTKWDRCEIEFSEIRKAYAMEFTRPENKEISAILFSMLDGKDVRPVIWKQVRKLAIGNPMVDAHNT